MWPDPDFISMGKIRYMLVGVSTINIYWFSKIVAMARKQLFLFTDERVVYEHKPR